VLSAILVRPHRHYLPSALHLHMLVVVHQNKVRDGRNEDADDIINAILYP